MKTDTSFLDDFIDKSEEEIRQLLRDKLKRKKQYEKTEDKNN